MPFSATPFTLCGSFLYDLVLKDGRQTIRRSRTAEGLGPKSKDQANGLSTIRLFNSTSWPPNGGFVPIFSKSRPFVINQLGGFVFQRALSFSHQPRGRPEARLVLLLLPFALCLLHFFPFVVLPPSACWQLLSALYGGFVPIFSKPRPFVINQLGGFVFRKLQPLAVGHRKKSNREGLRVETPSAGDSAKGD